MLSTSILYISITGELNGDFYGVPVSLSALAFGFVVLISLVPYILGYQLYLQFTRSAPAPTIHVGNAQLGCTFFIVTIWFIVLAINYGVGVMGRDIYEAPELVKLIIQITNRINPFYLGVFFIVGYQGSKRIIVLGIALLITLGILRAGLGIFMYVFLALIIRNHKNLRVSYHRLVPRLTIFIALILIITPHLYSIRSSMRESQNVNAEMSPTEIVLGRLVGRLSSISNTAFIYQNNDQFRSDVRTLDPAYFQRQMIAPLLGVWVIPEATPERLLINFHGSSLVNYSFMTGMPGNLTMAWFIDPIIAIFNAFTILPVLWLSFFFANKLALPYRNETCFLLLLYPLTSGVANELTSVLVSIVALLILFKFLNLFTHRVKSVST
jgi:hypothetical protein